MGHGTRTEGRVARWWLMPGAIALLGLMPLLAGADEAKEGDEAEGEEGAEDRGPVPPLPWDAPREGEVACEDEEILVLRDLRTRADELDRRQAALDERETALATLEAETAEKMEELQAIRTEITEMIGREKVASDERVTALARMVDTMKAREAASLLAGMNRDVALLVLRKVKPKQAGKILGEMPTETARELGDRMTVLADPRDTTDTDEEAR
jgi:flagellar motility protein MotE (MotC chaperone)